MTARLMRRKNRWSKGLRVFCERSHALALGPFTSVRLLETRCVCDRKAGLREERVLAQRDLFADLTLSLSQKTDLSSPTLFSRPPFSSVDSAVPEPALPVGLSLFFGGFVEAMYHVPVHANQELLRPPHQRVHVEAATRHRRSALLGNSSLE